MAQINLHVTAEFEEALSEFMRLRRVPTKSDAIRLAVKEAAQRESEHRRATDFSRWLGLARRAPENPAPRFRTDDDLWG
jgi:hypothetical protein